MMKNAREMVSVTVEDVTVMKALKAIYVSVINVIAIPWTLKYFVQVKVIVTAMSANAMMGLLEIHASVQMIMNAKHQGQVRYVRVLANVIVGSANVTMRLLADSVKIALYAELLNVRNSKT